MLQTVYEINKDFFLSDRIKGSTKIILPLALVLLALGTDYLFRFSDGYIASTKITQIEKIEALLQSKTLRAPTRQALLQLETQVIERQGLWDLPPALIRLIADRIALINSYANRPVSLGWHLASAGWAFWILILSSITLIFSKTITPAGALGILSYDLVLASLGGALAYALAFLPTLATPFNYIINALVSGIIVWTLVWISLHYEDAQADLVVPKPTPSSANHK